MITTRWNGGMSTAFVQVKHAREIGLRMRLCMTETELHSESPTEEEKLTAWKAVILSRLLSLCSLSSMNIPSMKAYEINYVILNIHFRIRTRTRISSSQHSALPCFIAECYHHRIDQASCIWRPEYLAISFFHFEPPD